jgi:hypothetical protein
MSKKQDEHFSSVDVAAWFIILALTVIALALAIIAFKRDEIGAKQEIERILRENE